LTSTFKATDQLKKMALSIQIEVNPKGLNHSRQVWEIISWGYSFIETALSMQVVVDSKNTGVTLETPGLMGDQAD